jgi:hypothetical protein
MTALAEAIAEAHIQKEYFSYCRIDTFLRNRELMMRWRRIGLRPKFRSFDLNDFDHQWLASHLRF